MNSKLILAIIIVALIGVVAATYQTSPDNLIDSLVPVETEDVGVTDLASADSEDSNVVEESVVTSDNTDNTNSKSSTSSNTVSSQTKTNNNNKNTANSNSNTNKKSNSVNSQKSNNANTNNNQKVNNANTFNPKISSAEALSIAKREVSSGKYRTATPTIYNQNVINGVPYYYISYHLNGKVVGEIEVNGNNGAVTGGAFYGEVTPPANNNTTTVENTSI